MTNPTDAPDPYTTSPTVLPAAGSPPTGDYRAADYPVGTGVGVTPSEYGASASSGSGQLTTDVAKQEAANVKDTAVDAGGSVAGTAKDEAANVVAETRSQAKSLLSTVTSEVKAQAGSQQQRLAGAVHSLAKEMGGMASSSQESGPLTDLAHQASRRGGEVAHWLENREPADVLDEVRRFARRRPGSFLVLCGIAGLVVARLGRGAVAANTSLDSKDTGSQQTPTSGTPYPGPSYAQPTYSQPTYTEQSYSQPTYTEQSYSQPTTPETTYGTGVPDTGTTRSLVEEQPTTYEDSQASDLAGGNAPVFGEDPTGRRDDIR